MQKDMTTGREWRHIVIFTIPLLLGNILQQLYNTIDGVVVGNYVGETALSAVGTCASLVMLFLAMCSGVGNAVGIIVAQYFGAKHYKDLYTAIRTGITLSAGLGICVAFLGIVFSPFLLDTLMGVPDSVLPQATRYFRIYCLGLPFQFVYNSLAYALRGLGDSKATLYFLIVSSVLNLLLDLLLVVVIPWGVSGVAVATVVSQLVCMVISYIYMCRKVQGFSFSLHLDKRVSRLILMKGLPSAIQQCIIAFGNVAMQRLVNSFGEVSMAAYTAGSRVDQMMFIFSMSFSVGMSSFTGQNVGAGKLDRVKRGLRDIVIIALVVSIVIGIGCYFCAEPIVRLFSLEGEALKRGVEQVELISLTFWLFTIYSVFCGVLTGSGDVVMQAVAAVVSLLARVVFGYLGVYLGVLGYNAAWGTMPLGWVVAVAMVVGRYATGRWKGKAVIQRQTAAK